MLLEETILSFYPFWSRSSMIEFEYCFMFFTFYWKKVPLKTQRNLSISFSGLLHWFPFLVANLKGKNKMSGIVVEFEYAIFYLFLSFPLCVERWSRSAYITTYSHTLPTYSNHNYHLWSILSFFKEHYLEYFALAFAGRKLSLVKPDGREVDNKLINQKMLTRITRPCVKLWVKVMVGNRSMYAMQVYMRRGDWFESLCFKERLANLLSTSLPMLLLTCINPCCIWCCCCCIIYDLIRSISLSSISWWSANDSRKKNWERMVKKGRILAKEFLITLLDNMFLDKTIQSLS